MSSHPMERIRQTCTCTERSHANHPNVDCNHLLVSQNSREEGICGLCMSEKTQGTNRLRMHINHKAARQRWLNKRIEEGGYSLAQK
jgi:hypothetical protein